MSMVCMPSFWLTCMVPGIWWILPSRIRFRTAVVPVMISSAAIVRRAFFLSKRLRDHGFDGFGELGANLRLLSGRKNVDDTIDGFGRAGGMQRAEDDVAGFGRGQSELDGFQVAHFADQNDIGVFTQRGAQRIGEGVGVRPQLALVDQAFFRLVHELDRILDG